MNRKEFIKKTATLGAGIIGMPYLLPTGRLFAASGSRIVNHVVLCLFAGGIRNNESVHKIEGNLMPNLLSGTEPISSDILPLLKNLPTLSAKPLQEYGTIYQEFRFNSLYAGHYQGNTTALTGQYVDPSIRFNDYTKNPSIFEYYLKHNSPAETAKKCWWVSNSSGENEFLSHSQDPSYGAAYAANFLCPNVFIPSGAYQPVDLCRTFSPKEKVQAETMRSYLNNHFGKSVKSSPNFTNTPSDRESIDAFLDKLIDEANQGGIADPWGTGFMSGDMYNVHYAEKVIQEFQPELLVVNMTEVDICHSDFSQYCVNLNKADYAAAHLWNTIQNTPGMKDDTIMIVVPEHGRDGVHNSITNMYGRKGIDHGGDAVSKEIFCLVAGPSNKVYQNNLISTVEGESIDIVPTIAHILGFDNDIPSSYLSGKPLKSAFK